MFVGQREKGKKIKELSSSRKGTKNSPPTCLSSCLRNVPALSAERYALKDPSQVYSLNGILHVNQSKGSQEAKDEATLETIVNHLEKSYCGKIAYEFTHIPVRNNAISYLNSAKERSEKKTHPRKICLLIFFGY